MKDLLEAIKMGDMNSLDIMLNRMGLDVAHVGRKSTNAHLIIGASLQLVCDDGGSWWIADKSAGILREEWISFDEPQDVVDYLENLMKAIENGG